MTIQDILDALADLKEEYDVHTIDDAWYSFRAMSRAVGYSKWDEHPAVTAVRAETPGRGMLELHPTENDKVHVRCYCCFGPPGAEDHGMVCLADLKAKVESMRDHNCPPWTG